MTDNVYIPAPLKAPVLFLVFNRPDTTRQVFEAIRKAKPPRLYVAADGPRQGRVGEAEKVAEVREIAAQVDWKCELNTLFREKNLGCKYAVSGAITWFFEHEEEGIILEDDCLPDPSFFTYCNELLAHYRNDPRVMCISGDNFISGVWQPTTSYYFSHYVHIWGWATWKRAWQHYDVEMEDWKKTKRKTDFLKKCLPHAPQSIGSWKLLFDKVSSGGIDTWDYQWVYACWKQQALSCMPNVNLISNIGFGEGATHTLSPESKLSKIPLDKISFPLNHPQKITATETADIWTNHNIFEFGRDKGILDRMRNLASKLKNQIAGMV